MFQKVKPAYSHLFSQKDLPVVFLICCTCVLVCICAYASTCLCMRKPEGGVESLVQRLSVSLSLSAKPRALQCDCSDYQLAARACLCSPVLAFQGGCHTHQYLWASWESELHCSRLCNRCLKPAWPPQPLSHIYFYCILTLLIYLTICLFCFL